MSPQICSILDRAMCPAIPAVHCANPGVQVPSTTTPALASRRDGVQAASGFASVRVSARDRSQANRRSDVQYGTAIFNASMLDGRGVRIRIAAIQQIRLLSRRHIPPEFKHGTRTDYCGSLKNSNETSARERRFLCAAKPTGPNPVAFPDSETFPYRTEARFGRSSLKARGSCVSP